MTITLPDPATGETAPAGTAGAAHSAYVARSRFGSLDGLRCLCILAVIWHHSPWWTGIAGRPRLLERGFVGVDFFFVLSGFLITTLLLREAGRKGRFSLAGFYWRRALRILPVYYFVVTFVAAYLYFVSGRAEILPLLPYYYAFLSNFLVEQIPLLSPTWSLAVEEQYYLIWPLALLILPRRLVLPVLALVIGANVLGATEVFGLSPATLGPLRFSLPSATYAPILIGSALALLLDRGPVFAALWPVLGRRGAAPLAFAAILVLLQSLPDDLRGLPNLVLHLAMAVALAALVMREDHMLAAPLRWRPIARIGEISYGIYLYHLLALHAAGLVLERLGLASGPVVLVAYLALSILIAEISDRTLESFFRKFRNRGPGAGA